MAASWDRARVSAANWDRAKISSGAGLPFYSSAFGIWSRSHGKCEIHEISQNLRISKQCHRARVSTTSWCRADVSLWAGLRFYTSAFGIWPRSHEMRETHKSQWNLKNRRNDSQLAVGIEQGFLTANSDRSKVFFRGRTPCLFCLFLGIRDSTSEPWNVRIHEITWNLRKSKKWQPSGIERGLQQPTEIEQRFL